MSRREHWRGIMEWLYEGLPLTSPSNQACKMYDAVLTQVVGFYDDPLLGGIEGTFKSMFEADPDFVLGRCLEINLMLVSALNSPISNPKLAESIATLTKLSETNKNLLPRERSHIEATLKFTKGDLAGASQKWEKILTEFPTDLLALKTAYDVYLERGKPRQLRDSVARVLPFWQSSEIPLKGYLHGMLGFGLCETNFFDKAEVQARKALEWNMTDGWAIHSLSHVFEMTVRPDEGLKVMKEFDEGIKVCNILTRHNYWHKSLCHLEIGEPDETIRILDDILIPHVKGTPHALDLVDTVSLLSRLGIAGPEKKSYKEQWEATFQAVNPYVGTRVSSFQDAHYILACCASGNDSVAESILASLTEQDHFYVIDKDMVKALFEALILYSRGKFGEAVELLLPIKYQLINLGGSEAQRDLFQQILIISAIKSNTEEHRKLAEHLLIERENLRSNSKLTANLVRMTYKNKAN